MNNWYERAACQGTNPNDWLPRDGEERHLFNSRAQRLARQYCAHCPVLADCKAEADHHRDIGLRAGAVRRTEGARYLLRDLLHATPNRVEREGETHEQVPVAPVREHVLLLLAAGWTLGDISVAARRPIAVIRSIRDGRAKHSMRRSVAEAVLAVQVGELVA